MSQHNAPLSGAAFRMALIGRILKGWQSRSLGQRLGDLCLDNACFGSPWGMVDEFGAAEMAVLPMLSSFPDMQMTIEDLIWDRNYADVASLRLTLTGHHIQPGPYGAPTGSPVSARCMVELRFEDSMIADLYLIQDSSALCRQCGMDAQDHGRRMAGNMPNIQPVPDVVRETGHESDWGKVWHQILMAAFSEGPGNVRKQLDPAIQSGVPGGRTSFGVTDVAQNWTSLATAFPAARFSAQHVIGQEENLMPPRASVRWTLRGRHDGWGAFGAPSGAQVQICGISQAEFGPEGVRREFTIYDETTVWAQIHRHIGRAA